jgi:hypothetical protein
VRPGSAISCASFIAVQAAQRRQSLLPRDHGRTGSEADLGTEPGVGNGRGLIDELVHADLPPFRELTEALMLVVGEADRQGDHSVSPGHRLKPRAKRRAAQIPFMRERGRTVMMGSELVLRDGL